MSDNNDKNQKNEMIPSTFSEGINSDLLLDASEVAFSAAGAIVGYVLSGPTGAILGGVISPVAKLSFSVVQLWYKRKKDRLTRIIENAFSHSGKTDEEILQQLIDKPEWCDALLSMIRQLLDTDSELDVLFSQVISAAISTEDDSERNRLLVLSNSIKGLNRVQLLILKKMYESGNVLSASQMSSDVSVPEIELRNAVRDLELRGMIEDNGQEPTIWTLRELGISIALTIIKMEDSQ